MLRFLRISQLTSCNRQLTDFPTCALRALRAARYVPFHCRRPGRAFKAEPECIHSHSKLGQHKQLSGCFQVCCVQRQDPRSVARVLCSI